MMQWEARRTRNNWLHRFQLLVAMFNVTPVHIRKQLNLKAGYFHSVRSFKTTHAQSVRSRKQSMDSGITHIADLEKSYSFQKTVSFEQLILRPRLSLKELRRCLLHLLNHPWICHPAFILGNAQLAPPRQASTLQPRLRCTLINKSPRSFILVSLRQPLFLGKAHTYLRKIPTDRMAFSIKRKSL